MDIPKATRRTCARLNLLSLSNMKCRNYYGCDDFMIKDIGIPMIAFGQSRNPDRKKLRPAARQI
ncbi:MAG: hypothetical protein GDA53_11515 [Rhodobacteraceae bacterium]|nr:hypothetical protein [Paracoccaceae bacterium]